jgi:hypothetical protein
MADVAVDVPTLLETELGVTAIRSIVDVQKYLLGASMRSMIEML